MPNVPGHDTEGEAGFEFDPQEAAVPDLPETHDGQGIRDLGQVMIM
jgi:hypothetical protein